MTPQAKTEVNDGGPAAAGSPQPLAGGRWVVCQLGARMHYAVPRMLDLAGKLERFYTDVYGGERWTDISGRLPQKWCLAGLRRLVGRVAGDLPEEKVRPQFSFGLLYYLLRTMAPDSERMSAVHLWAGRTFGNRVVKQGFGDATAVYTFNTAGLEILQAARTRGLFTVVEQTIVPRSVEDSLLQQEHARHPGWESTKKFGPAAEMTARRETEEWALADLIVCGSEFVREGIAQCGGPVERCAVIPYGVDSHFGLPDRQRDAGPLRVLTVGELGLRKGAPYCLEAARALGDAAEFRWVGSSILSPDAKKELAKGITLKGAVPRTQILSHYAWADVFFLPSVCEGSATVTYEALACGLPVLTTPNAGSTVVDGITGFVVPIRDTQAMIARLRLLHQDRALLKRMSVAAVEYSRELSLTAYQHRLLNLLDSAFHATHTADVSGRGAARIKVPDVCAPRPHGFRQNQTDLNGDSASVNVSAIMAAWSRDSKTLDTLKRIMMCNPAPAEILVHVDGGNDDLASRIREHYPEVRVMLSHERLGPGGARNLLLRAASHPLVASFDDDSYPINRDYFAAVESEFENHPEASILFAAVRDIEEPEGPKFTTIRRSAAFVGCGCAYRRSAFLGTSGYVPLQLAYGMEEVDLSMRLHAQGAIILQSPRLKVHHDTDLRHRLAPTVNAAVTSNAALLVFLRYPLILWPLGFLQFLKIVYRLMREGRSRGIWNGVLQIPAQILQYRSFRKTLRPAELMSYIALRRRCAREDVLAP